MDSTSKEIRVFYSWQSDLPDSTNRAALRQALRLASTEIENKLAGIRITIDEATRDEPGAPNIPATILRKIETADIIVADVTTINNHVNEPEAAPRPRPTPNPNVVFELGYAVANLGWSRVILLFNEEYGSINQLPFDFDRHRASPYRLALGATTNQQRSIAKLVEPALFSIINAKPKRPSEVKARAEQEIRRERDVQNLERALSKIHIPSLETHIEEDPHRILHSLDFCWIDFNAVVGSTQFHLHDKEADALLRALHDAWWRSLQYSVEYHPDFTPIRRAFIFMEYDDPYHMSRGPRQKRWDEMSAARGELSIIWPKLVSFVQERYLELNIREMSMARWSEYEEWHRQLFS